VARKKDYYSFEEVLADLQLEEDELKRLVSAGEIRAFREKDTMRFKAADIERLKSSSAGANAGSGIEELDLAADLDLDLDAGTELELGEAPTAAAAPASEELDLAADAGAGAGAAPSRRAARSQAVAAVETKDSAGLLFALGLGILFLIFANFAALGAVDGTTNAMTRILANMFG